GRLAFWGGFIAYEGALKREVTTNGRVQPDSYQIVERLWRQAEHALPGADLLQKMTYLELKQRLAELLLMRVDKMTMATSVEARVPYLDHKLLEFAMSIPSGLKYHKGETKHILKRALKGVIPNRVLNREKKGFGVPINEWMLDRLGGFVEDALFNSSLRRRDLFDYDFVRRLLAEHRKGRVNYAFFLWSL